MSSRSSLTVRVSEKVRAAIEQWTEQGNYGSAGAFVEEAVREKIERAKERRLAQLLAEGLDSGPAIPADTDLWEGLKRDARARAGKSEPKTTGHGRRSSRTSRRGKA